jgi:small subunit ribosomal protein S3
VGQKVHPGGMRVGVIHDWKSNWYTGNKDFADFLQEDVRIREHIYNKLSHAGLSDILIRKDAQRITIDIYTARPGIVIGKSGVEVDALRKDIHGMTSKAVHININEIKRPELDAKLVAQSIAEQLENRVSFRRAMKRSLASAIRSGAQGVKVMCGGRLGGGEMSRSESYSEGRVPLHTIRADIDYGFAEAKTTTGRIGVKVWINKGEIMPSGYESSAQQGDTRLGEQDQARRRGGRTEGLGESRQGGRGRGADREGLGPVRQRRPRRGSGQGRGPRRPREQAPGETVEQPRTEEQGVSAEGREAQVVEPQVEETPATVADAPDTTTTTQIDEDPTKGDKSGDEGAEKQKPTTKATTKAAPAKKPAAKKAPTARAKPTAKRAPKKEDKSAKKEDES